MFGIQYLRKSCALWHQGQLGDENFTQPPSSWIYENIKEVWAFEFLSFLIKESYGWS